MPSLQLLVKYTRLPARLIGQLETLIWGVGNLYKLVLFQTTFMSPACNCKYGHLESLWDFKQILPELKLSFIGIFSQLFLGSLETFLILCVEVETVLQAFQQFGPEKIRDYLINEL